MTKPSSSQSTLRDIGVLFPSFAIAPQKAGHDTALGLARLAAPVLKDCVDLEALGLCTDRLTSQWSSNIL